MCEFCDRINYGIMSMHNEASLDNKNTSDVSVFRLEDQHGKEIGKFQFPACPMCRKPLGQLGIDMFGDLRQYVVHGYKIEMAKNIEPIIYDKQLRTPMMALQVIANVFNKLIHEKHPSIFDAIRLNYHAKHLELNEEYLKEGCFSIYCFEDPDSEKVNGIGTREYTVNDNETDCEYKLCMKRLEL